MNFDVKNKNILITGATSGIGKSAALKLAEMKANIFSRLLIYVFVALN